MGTAVRAAAASRSPARPGQQPLAVAFSEVRHFQPEDCLHVEALSVRGQGAGGWTIPAHRHDGLHQFQWLHQGRVTATIDTQPFALVAPAALLVAPGAVHGFDYSADAQGLQLTLPAPLLQQALADAPLLPGSLARSRCFTGADLAGLAAVPGLLAQLLDEYQHGRPGRVEALKALALLLALAFVRSAQAQDPPADSPRGPALRDTLVQRYRSLVGQQFRSGQPVAAYAQALGITPDHLSRCCRAMAGQSALDLLHERVLLEARRLLAYTEAPVAAVAQQLGYDDALYFSRFFARHSGVPPSAYRAGVRQGLVGRPEQAGR